MQESQLRERVERFASLQAAYRALARSVHPAELATVREKSRSLLIDLQGLSSGRTETPGDAESASLASIDQALEEQTERTLAILAGIELSQMRATIPMLSARHPDEVAGLVDVLLSGCLEEDKNLRTLEYLITMLSADERGGRRVIIKEPGQVTSQLRERTRRASSEPDGEWVAAERVLETAASKVLQQGEIGDTRDRMRRYKQELGAEILHPRVLAAAVAYNVAMWNRVAAEIDGSRAMEQLAEDLFDQRTVEAMRERPEASVSSTENVMSGTVFPKLVEAFARRLSGESLGDDPIARIASLLSIDALRTEDAEAFESDGDDESNWLMRSAVVVGLILKDRQRIGSAAEAAGLSIEDLETQCLGELVEKMSERARKFFAASSYAEAFRLSDVKTHNLIPFANAYAEAGAASAGAGMPVAGSSGGTNFAQAESGSFGVLGSWLRPGPIFATALIALISGYLLMGPSLSNGPESTGFEASSISPFLGSGAETGSGPMRSFNGRINAAWDYLGTPERREVTDEMGRHFAAIGITRVVLSDASDQVMAIYANGNLVVVVPREGPTEATTD